MTLTEKQRKNRTLFWIKEAIKSVDVLIEHDHDALPKHELIQFKATLERNARLVEENYQSWLSNEKRHMEKSE